MLRRAADPWPARCGRSRPRSDRSGRPRPCASRCRAPRRCGRDGSPCGAPGALRASAGGVRRGGPSPRSLRPRHAWRYAPGMFPGIDHLVIAVADPDAAAAEVHDVLGLAPGGGGRHDRLGTFNRLVWLGDTYLELIGVVDPALAATSWIGAPTLRSLAAGTG